MRTVTIVVAAIVVSSCQAGSDEADSVIEEAAAEIMQAASAGASDRLATTLAAQPEDVQARYPFRHPLETLRFFKVEPGMTVVEGLPGAGWYTKVLLPYLGGEGSLIGADYAQDMWPLFGFFGEEFIEGRKTWVAEWPADADQWRDDDSATVSAFKFGSMPETLNGTADRVLFIRVLHNVNRFDSQGGYMTAAIADAFAALKPGGIFGVVQHQARDDKSDDFANGSHGYLKKAHVIARIESAGFEFVDESTINQNDNDVPSDDDVVWRLAPNLHTSGDDPELNAEITKIGESNRMTLKFRKPG